VWLSRDELKVLADHLKLTERETVRQHCRLINGRLSLKERRVARGKFDCVFLKDLPGGKKGCGIYHVRPLQCRTWPFWDGNLQDEAAWREAGTTCPGLNRGKHFTSDDIEALRDADAWPEESPSSSYGDDASANETAHEHQRR
jgi:Fe-S-cluster containining protein